MAGIVSGTSEVVFYITPKNNVIYPRMLTVILA
jgi:hypothetical protein